MSVNTTDMSVEDALARLAELRDQFASMDEGARSDAEGMRSKMDEVHQLDAFITSAMTIEAYENRAKAARPVATAGAGSSGFRTGADYLREDADWQAFIGRQANGDLNVQIPVGIEGFRTVVSEWAAGGPLTYDATGTGNLLPVGQPIPPIPRQAKLYLRDLIPKMSTTLASIPYVQELNPTNYELGASAVAEAGGKPDATLSFQGAHANPTVLATTLTLSKQMFDDAEAVVQYINQRLPYLVKFKEDNEFLNGSGTWPDITGIFNTSGLQSQGATSGDPALSIGNSFAKLENSDGTPTAVVLNPTDAWTMFLRRTSTSGVLDAGSPFSALPMTVWGVPTYRTRAMAAGTCLAADFERGAMVADREQVNIQTFRETLAKNNEVLLICEERVGLLVFRPDLFVRVTL